MPITQELPTNEVALVAPGNHASTRTVAETNTMLLNSRDIWVENIFKFLGMGHFVFVAGVCKDFKNWYTASCTDGVEKPPSKVYCPLEGQPYFEHSIDCPTRKALPTDTFCRTVFSSLACAKYWYDEITSTQGNTFHSKARSVSSLAAKFGDRQVMKWAHEVGFPWDRNTCAYAAHAGNLSVLKYARENGCPWDISTSYFAASEGHLEILKYAHENGCDWDERTCIEAAMFGDLETLKYLHENGCPWAKSTCTFAAMKGHLEALKYAHENGCPWDEGTCIFAATQGHQEIAEWAYANGCPWPDRLFLV